MLLAPGLVLAISFLLTARAPGVVFAFSILLISGATGVVVAFSIALTARSLGIVLALPIHPAHGESAGRRRRRRLDAGVIGPVLLCLLLTQARLSSRVHGSSDQKAIRKFNIVGVQNQKIYGQRRRKSGGGQASRPREGDFHAPASPRWCTDGCSFAGTP